MIPRKARKVFNGVLFDVYQWDQRMFDRSYAVFERLRRLPTVQIFATRKNKVLLLKEMQPGFNALRISMPGGKVERGEDPLQAAKRELLEETGFSSKDWGLVKAYASGRHKIEWPVYLYSARNCVKTADPHPDPGERIDIEWVSLKRFLDGFTENANDMMMDMLHAKYDKKKRIDLARKIFCNP
ncbi:MAG: NUDIX hydrolase [Candidatus Marsarchaeota archaeon]|nr:NUDIX hydrolase [Candidatus Marsarchaeota archaeon]